MNAPVCSQIAPLTWPGLVLVLAMCLPEITIPAQLGAASSQTNQPTTTMNTFVIIFRQGPRTLTDAEKQRRFEETSLWARRYNEAGHHLNPHILTPEREIRGESSVVTDAWPVTALLLLEAQDLKEAAAIAEAHPGLHYGATVEVRPWARPAPVAR